MSNSKTVGGALLEMVPRPMTNVTGKALLNEAMATLGGLSPEQTRQLQQEGRDDDGAPAKSFIEKLRGERTKAEAALEKIDDPVEFKAQREKLRLIDDRIKSYEAGAASAQK